MGLTVVTVQTGQFRFLILIINQLTSGTSSVHLIICTQEVNYEETHHSMILELIHSHVKRTLKIEVLLLCF